MNNEIINCFVQSSDFAVSDAATEVVVHTTNASFNVQPPVAVKQKPPAPRRQPAVVTGEEFPCRVCGKLVDRFLVIHCVSKNCTAEADRHKFIKISSPIMILHTSHRHSVAD